MLCLFLSESTLPHVLLSGGGGGAGVNLIEGIGSTLPLLLLLLFLAIIFSFHVKSKEYIYNIGDFQNGRKLF